MKKYILLLIGIILFIPYQVKASEVDYDITNFKIESNILDNGDVNVCEYIEQKGYFNGYVRDIYFSEGEQEYNPSAIENIKVYDLNTNNLSKGKEFVYDNAAFKGDNLKYYYSSTYNGISVTMFNHSEGERKGYVLCYTLKDAVLVHNDVAEFYYTFIPRDFTDKLNNVDITVKLPRNDETLRVWGHGELDGVVSKLDDGLNASISSVYPKNVVNIRMVFDKNLVPNSMRFTNKYALDEIIATENQLAQEANEKREVARKEIKKNIIILVAYILFVIGLIIYCYLKHDKEYKVDFDMEYYRELPQDFPPEILEYLLKKQITTNGYSACILNMICKKYFIVEKTDKDFILKKADKFDNLLTASEADIMEFLIKDIGDTKQVSLKEIKRYGRSTKTAEEFLDHFNDWKKSVLEVAKSYNFYEKFSNIKYIILLLLVAFLAGVNATMVSSIIIIISVAVIIYLSLITKKTKTGMLEYKKWMAFKKFLLDFGRFDEKELPEISLWGKYLVYATIFGIADKVEKAMKIKIEAMDDVTVINDTLFMNDMIRFNFAREINSTIERAHSLSTSQLASTSSSSGGGFGGGFSGGGGFSDGGGGGGGHGF